MTYSLIITLSNADPIYKNDILTWGEVTAILRHGLDQWTTSVHIYKYSSDNRLLGEKHVTMGNICDVAFALRDKNVLL
jgi:hypothetical protein